MGRNVGDDSSSLAEGVPFDFHETVGEECFGEVVREKSKHNIPRGKKMNQKEGFGQDTWALSWLCKVTSKSGFYKLRMNNQKGKRSGMGTVYYSRQKPLGILVLDCTLSGVM